MEIKSLFIASLLILIPIFISYKEKLGLEKDIFISIIRAVIQLVFVGYILSFVFDMKSPIVTSILIIILIMNAAMNTKKRGGAIKNVVLISFVSMFIGTIVTLLVLVLSKAIQFIPSEVIPISGMVISNSMVAVGLSYQNLNNAFNHRHVEIEVKLSLGATIKDASASLIKESIKMAMVPTIDSIKTLGIVSLPGMMTGLMLAGTSPLIAIRFQIMVTFMLLSATSFAAMIATYLSYRRFFNERKQLLKTSQSV